MLHTHAHKKMPRTPQPTGSRENKHKVHELSDGEKDRKWVERGQEAAGQYTQTHGSLRDSRMMGCPWMSPLNFCEGATRTMWMMPCSMYLSNTGMRQCQSEGSSQEAGVERVEGENCVNIPPPTQEAHIHVHIVGVHHRTSPVWDGKPRNVDLQ